MKIGDYIIVKWCPPEFRHKGKFSIIEGIVYEITPEIIGINRGMGRIDIHKKNIIIIEVKK